MAKKPKPQKQPFLPLFVGDFLGATDEWEGEEQGLYLACLLRQWAGGSLPADPVKLCRQLRWSQANFDRYWPVVSRKFAGFDDPQLGARIKNIRLEEHREKTIEIGKKNSANGKKGAEKTWRKNGERHTETKASAIESDGERHKSAIQKVMAPGHGNPSHPIPSHPDPSQDQASLSPQGLKPGTPTPRARTGVNGAGDEAHELRTEIESAYPAGLHRGDHWMLAERAIRKLLEQGESADALKAAAAKYCEQQTAIENLGTAQVLRPSTFFGTDAWRGPFPIPDAAGEKPETLAEIITRLESANG